MIAFLRRLQYTELTARYPNRPLAAVFALVNGFVSIALMAGAALITNTPMIFPSLGPTAFLFFYTPLAPAASPRNTLIGHAVGATAGWTSLAVFGLLDAEPALISGVTGDYVLAAGTSLGATAGAMVLLRAPHPPAGATTLIVALGLLTEITDLVILMLAVALLTAQAFVINRLAGLPYPVWATPGQGPRAADG